MRRFMLSIILIFSFSQSLSAEIFNDLYKVKLGQNVNAVMGASDRIRALSPEEIEARDNPESKRIGREFAIADIRFGAESELVGTVSFSASEASQLVAIYLDFIDGYDVSEVTVFLDSTFGNHQDFSTDTMIQTRFWNLGDGEYYTMTTFDITIGESRNLFSILEYSHCRYSQNVDCG